MRTSGESLLTIINDILDFSKVEAGKMDLEQAVFDLRECLEGALDLVAIRGRGEEPRPRLHRSTTACRPRSSATSTRLRQVLVNLLNNAIKFTEQGEVVVSVAVADAGRARHELALRRPRHGHWHSCRWPEPTVPTLQPGRPVDQSQVRRHGSGVWRSAIACAS